MSFLPDLRILVLYDECSTHTATVLEHLRSFRLSRHDVFFAPAVRGAPLALDLAAFDVVVIHYSVRLSLPDFISRHVVAALPAFSGLKILFIQDEYDTTETARQWMNRIGFDVVFTCVPAESVESVYPKARFSKTEFITTLTGFVPRRFEGPLKAPPIADRKLFLAYRGRALPFWYGQLGREKVMIGQGMKEICANKGVPCDIEWDEDHRIYGEAWYEFLMSARATLATESGANVFDDYGDIRRSIEVDLAKNPHLSFDEIHARWVAPHEGKVRMNQISPRIFEAIAVGTGLVLFEGEYSGILRAWDHYLPLKKDFSNADEILTKLGDDDLMTAMIERTHRDIIQSGQYTYTRAMKRFDDVLERRAKRTRTHELFAIAVGAFSSAERPAVPTFTAGATLRGLATSEPLLHREADQHFVEQLTTRHLLSRASWRALPRTVQSVLRPVLPWVRPTFEKLWRR